MDAILKKLDEVKEELKKEIELKVTDMKIDFAEVKEELKKVKAEWEEKANIWQKEKGEMEKRISNLENKLEKQEKEKRRNNVVIKGIDFDKEQPGNQYLKQKVVDYFQKEMEIEIKVEEAFKVGKTEEKVTVVKCAEFDHKLELLKLKRKLPGSIYIDSDLTMEERKVQLAIRNVARGEKNNGKKTRVGYRKLEVDGIKYEWSQEGGGRLIRADIPKNEQH